MVIDSAPRSIAVILGSNGANLGSLRRRVAYLQQIQNAVNAALPDNAAPHVRVADYVDGRLLLIVDSGSWATRLRYQQRAIAQSLARRPRLGVDDLEIRVRPLPDPAPGPAQPRHLSESARKLIADCSHYVDDNPALSSALARLSKAGNR